MVRGGSDVGARETSEIDDGEIESIGEEFATEYYRRAPRSERDRFYDDKSKFVFLQFGTGPDYTAQGADQIARLEAQITIYSDEECAALNVMSIDTILVKRNWLAVLAVCELNRGPGDDEEQPSSRKFVQSTVVRYAPLSSSKKYVVVGTVIMFDDKIVDNVFVQETEPQLLLSVDAVNKHPATDKNNNDDSDDPSSNTASIETAELRSERIEKTATVNQLTAPGKKKAAKKASVESHIDSGKKQDDTPVIVPVKLKMKQKPPAEKQNDTPVTVPGKLKMIQKPPADIQPAAISKDPLPKESTRNPTDENTTNMDGAVLTTESKTKQKSSKKKKSTVTEEVPASAIGKSKVSNEHVSAKGTSKSSTGKKKGSVKENAPVVVAELYVGKLSKLIDIVQLNATFGKFGKLLSTNIFEAPGKKGQPNRQNYGIIQYEDPEIVDFVATFSTVVLGNGDEVIVEKSKRNQQPNTKTH